MAARGADPINEPWGTHTVFIYIDPINVSHVCNSQLYTGTTIYIYMYTDR